ncbi:MAG: murein biosynthesis integral membrane protein MurJ [Caldisericum sp.]
MKRTQTPEIASILFALSNVISKLLGFVRDLFLSNYFGVSKSVDALSATLPINSIFQNLMTSAIVVSFIPLFLEEIANDRVKAEKDLSALFNLLFIIFLILAIVLMVSSNALVNILAPGFKDETLRNIMGKLIDFVSISAFLWAIVGFLFGVAQSKKHFFITAFTPLLANLFTIFGLVFFHKTFGIYSYVIGMNIGLILQFLVMAYYSKKYLNLKFGMYFSVSRNLLSRLFVLSLPLILLQLTNYFVTLLSNRIASTLSEGSIASIQYANKLRQLWVSLLTVPIATAYYPFLSEAAITGNFDQLSQIFRRSAEFALILGIPITVVSFAFANPIVQIVFKRGAFNEEAVILTTLAFKYFSIGIFALMITTLAMRVLYALKEMYLVLIVSVVIAAINILLFYPLVKVFGHAGIPFAISIGIIIETIAFLIALEIKTHIKLGEFFISVLKITVPSLVSVILMYFIYNIAIRFIGNAKTLNILVSFTISSVVFIISYFILLKIFKVEELDTIIKIFNK